MAIPEPGPRFANFFERESLRPDLNRAIRSTIAFLIPLIAAQMGWLRIDPVHACITAQTIAMVDVRGAYSLRLGLLLSMTAVLTASVLLGRLGVDGLEIALPATALVVLGGGLWRHLSSDYGPGLAVSSGLLFFVSLAPDSPVVQAHHPALATFCGGLLGVMLQVSLWPFHPQHPLRRTVADSWIALAELLQAMSPEERGSGQAIRDKEIALRAALNESQATLHASKRHSGKVLRHLELLNLASARLALRVIGFQTALENFEKCPGHAAFEAGLTPVVASLTNTARTVALAVVSGAPSHWAMFEVRLKRLETLLTVARTQVTSQLGDSPASGQLLEILRQIEEQLPIVHAALQATLERTTLERAAFSLELFDLGTLTLRPLGAILNLSKRVEPALVRHTFRAMVLSVIGVALFKWSGFPHGYWLPFTMLVVLQPDFGSTREKAAQRVLGTLAGGLIASSLLWLHPPLPVLFVAIAVTIFAFGYFLKRNYAVAVIFITLMVVLLTESHHPVTLAFTLERMGSTLAGGLLSLAAALIFWPEWERDRFPGIVAKSLEANFAYLSLITFRLKDGGTEDDELIQARQAVEMANSEAFSSLKRMNGDPKNRQDGLQQAAALANGNQRITNALAVIALHFNDQQTRHPEMLRHFTAVADAAFRALIETETTGRPSAAINRVMEELKNFRLPEIEPDHLDADRFREPWTYPQLFRVVTELSAMLLIARG
ncbi:MAG: FUSC family protein [Verrucomicrobiota bacterium]